MSNRFEICGIDESSEDRIKHFTKQFIRDSLKEKGYIRKSLVEEAEYMYRIHNSSSNFEFKNNLIEKLYDAIQYQKAEIERYKSQENCKMEEKK